MIEMYRPIGLLRLQLDNVQATCIFYLSYYSNLLIHDFKFIMLRHTVVKHYKN